MDAPSHPPNVYVRVLPVAEKGRDVGSAVAGPHCTVLVAVAFRVTHVMRIAEGSVPVSERWSCSGAVGDEQQGLTQTGTNTLQKVCGMSHASVSICLFSQGRRDTTPFARSSHRAIVCRRARGHEAKQASLLGAATRVQFCCSVVLRRVRARIRARLRNFAGSCRKNHAAGLCARTAFWPAKVLAHVESKTDSTNCCKLVELATACSAVTISTQLEQLSAPNLCGWSTGIANTAAAAVAKRRRRIRGTALLETLAPLPALLQNSGA